jgi:hypothetical protein
MASRPPYIPQLRDNTCWAACLQMWMAGEIGTYFSQGQIVQAAGDFVIGPGGIDIDALGATIDRVLSLSTVTMEWRKVDDATKLPYIGLILKEVGNVYVGYRTKEGGGHVNIIYGSSSSGYEALDPNPAVQAVVRSHQYYFSTFSCFVGWRRTSAMIGLDYTGRPPWQYAP